MDTLEKYVQMMLSSPKEDEKHQDRYKMFTNSTAQQAQSDLHTHKQPLVNFEFPKHEISSADRDSIQLQEEDLLHESMTEAGRHKGAGEELQFYMSYSSFLHSQTVLSGTIHFDVRNIYN